jgi:hypothetical protein
VADLVDGVIDDPDINATTGVAITAVDKTDASGNALSSADSGKWQYRTATNADTTLNWVDLPSVTTNQALLLTRAGELRYLPNASAVDTLITSLTVRAWDTTSGSTGTTADVTIAGGSTAFSSNSRQANLRVNGVSLSNNLPGLTFTEGGTAAAGSGITLSNTSGTLSAASVQIVKGLSDGDQLQLASSFSNSAISSQWDASTGVLSLSGTASAGEYQAALQAVEFRSGDDPTALVSKRTIGFFLGSSSTTQAYLDVAITASVDQPVITPGALATFTESGAAVAITPSLNLSDVDDTQIASATVSISANRQSGDTLSLNAALATDLGITSSYDSNTGVLSITGTAKVSAYQEALRAVQFSSSNAELTANGAAPNRSISWSVVDGNSDGAGPATGTATGTLAIQAVNSAPLITLGSSGSSVPLGSLNSTAGSSVGVPAASCTHACGSFPPAL